MSGNNVIALRQSIDGWRVVGQCRLAVVEKIDSKGGEATVGIDGSRLWMRETISKGNTIRHTTSLTPHNLCECIYKVTGVKPTVRYQQDDYVTVRIGEAAEEPVIQTEPTGESRTEDVEPQCVVYSIHCRKKKIPILERLRLFFSKSKIVVSDMSNVAVTTSGSPNIIGAAKIYSPTQRDHRHRAVCHVPGIGSFTDNYVLNEEFEKRVDMDGTTKDCKFDVVCSTTKDIYRLELLIKSQISPWILNAGPCYR